MGAGHTRYTHAHAPISTLTQKEGNSVMISHTDRIIMIMIVKLGFLKVISVYTIASFST